MVVPLDGADTKRAAREGVGVVWEAARHTAETGACGPAAAAVVVVVAPVVPVVAGDGSVVDAAAAAAVAAAAAAVDENDVSVVCESEVGRVGAGGQDRVHDPSEVEDYPSEKKLVGSL